MSKESNQKNESNAQSPSPVEPQKPASFLPPEHEAFLQKIKDEQEEINKDPEKLLKQLAKREEHREQHERVFTENQAQEERGEVVNPSLDDLRALIGETNTQETEEAEVAIEEEGDVFTYRGIKVEGVSFLEERGVLTKEDVQALLDRLPEGFIKYVPLDKIVFYPYKFFSLIREGELHMVKEDEILPEDTVYRRVRGGMHWNYEFENDVALPSDGKMTIEIFNPIARDDKKEGETDQDVVLYTLAHELGHATMDTLKKAKDYYEFLLSRGKEPPKSLCPIDFQPLIEAWNNLPESTLERYLEYKPIFMREAERVGDARGKHDVEVLAHEEDFATAHERYLYWQDLETMDEDRHGIIDLTYEMLNEH